MRNYLNTVRSNRAGFTLIEILAVLSIIIIIMGLAVGLVAVVNQKTSEAKAHRDIAIIQQALEQHKTKDRDRSYPRHMNEAEYVIPQVIWPFLGGVNSDDFVDENGTTNTLFIDPWGMQYRYVKHSEYDIVVGSFGRDREPGVEGLDDNGNGRSANDYEDLGYGDDITNRSQ